MPERDPAPWRRAAPPMAAQPPRAREREAELRMHGANAVRALFARRPQALRKLYLARGSAHHWGDVMRWCAAHRVGYRIVEDADLCRLAGSDHHEGVVADVLRAAELSLAAWLRGLPPGPACALWLDGVGNPHNLGAIVRNAAHFGASVLLPRDSPLALSGAAARVAEGGAESVPMVRVGRADNTLAQLRGAGFEAWATLVDGGEDVLVKPVPQRLVYVIGAEQSGMDRAFAGACDARVSIPGSGAVESLNVASASAVLLARWAGRPR